MKKMLLSILKLLVLVYILICVLLYFFQEKLIFFPEKLASNFSFSFNRPFNEVKIKVEDDALLHAILFTCNNPKGVIFYLHGNAGSVNSWGDVAGIYTDLNYDVFMVDYRGYGKSEGKISNESRFYKDVQTAYDQLKLMYDEHKIVVLGYSIGTGPAAKVASENNPKMLILQAAYFSLPDLMKRLYPIIPTFILRYKFETSKFLSKCKMPVVLFHGDRDEIIYYESAVKLKTLTKNSDRLITLKGTGHNGMSSDPVYLAELQKILTE